MTVSLEQVHAKARAFVDALCKLARDQYGAPPGARFGRDYNRLLELAREAAADIDPRLWPEPVALRQGPDGESCAASYVEIETYVRQLMELALVPRMDRRP